MIIFPLQPTRLTWNLSRTGLFRQLVWCLFRMKVTGCLSSTRWAKYGSSMVQEPGSRLLFLISAVRWLALCPAMMNVVYLDLHSTLILKAMGGSSSIISCHLVPADQNRASPGIT